MIRSCPDGYSNVFRDNASKGDLAEATSRPGGPLAPYLGGRSASAIDL